MVRLDPDKRILTGPHGKERLSPSHFRFMCAFIKAGFNQPVCASTLYELSWPDWQPAYAPASMASEIYRLNQVLRHVGGARVISVYGAYKVLRATCAHSSMSRAA